jgi:integrase/recombinase XerD
MNQLSPVPASGRRHRLVEDMTVRGFSDKTRKYYICIVSGFAAFLGRSPATATAEDVRRFQVHQSGMGACDEFHRRRAALLLYLHP